MKTEDFERLKAICEKEGFTIESYCGGKTAIVGVKDVEIKAKFLHHLQYRTDSKCIGFDFKLSKDYNDFDEKYLNQVGNFLSKQIEGFMNTFNGLK